MGEKVKKERDWRGREIKGLRKILILLAREREYPGGKERKWAMCGHGKVSGLSERPGRGIFHPDKPGRRL